MSEVSEFEKEVEKYRLLLKEKLDSSTGKDWIIEAEVAVYSFIYNCEIDGFQRETQWYDVEDLDHENRLSEAIEREAFLIPYEIARERELTRKCHICGKEDHEYPYLRTDLRSISLDAQTICLII